MALFQVMWVLFKFTLMATAQARIGVLGALLLSMVVVGIRVRHNALAVGAAVAFVLMMTQA